MRSSSAPPDDTLIERAIVALLRARGPLASVCPSEVARALPPADADWRERMPRVHAVAARMAAAGTLRITQGQRTLTPDVPARGPVRLRRGDGFGGSPARRPTPGTAD